jgi:hypothetical protein
LKPNEDANYLQLQSNENLILSVMGLCNSNPWLGGACHQNGTPGLAQNPLDESLNGQ